MSDLTWNGRLLVQTPGRPFLGKPLVNLWLRLTKACGLCCGVLTEILPSVVEL